jgi:hypothetical protein
LTHHGLRFEPSMKHCAIFVADPAKNAGSFCKPFRKGHDQLWKTVSNHMTKQALFAGIPFAFSGLPFGAAVTGRIPNP